MSRLGWNSLRTVPHTEDWDPVHLEIQSRCVVSGSDSNPGVPEVLVSYTASAPPVPGSPGALMYLWLFSDKMDRKFTV